MLVVAMGVRYNCVCIKSNSLKLAECTLVDFLHKIGTEDLHDCASSLFTDGTGQVHSVLPETFQAGSPHCIGLCDDDLGSPKRTSHMQIRLLVVIALGQLGVSQFFDLKNQPSTAIESWSFTLLSGRQIC